MRISDWSSDVCSSDLCLARHADYAVPDTYPLFTACRTHGFAANRWPGTGCCTGSAKTRSVSRQCGGAGPMNQIASRGRLRMFYISRKYVEMEKSVTVFVEVGCRRRLKKNKL